MTHCEKYIAGLLEQELYLVKEEVKYDDGGNSFGSYFTYKVVR